MNEVLELQMLEDEVGPTIREKFASSLSINCSVS